MLYSLSIDPLLHKLRRELSGVSFPGCPSTFKLTAYADDIMVLTNKQKDIDVLKQNVDFFNKVSSAKLGKK